MIEITYFVKQARKKRGFSMRELGRRAGVGQSTISKIEQGENTTIYTLCLLAIALNTRPEALYRCRIIKQQN